jgi:hypothetical protein
VVVCLTLLDKVASRGRLPKRAGWFRLECFRRHHEGANIVNDLDLAGQVRLLLVACMTRGWWNGQDADDSHGDRYGYQY